MHYNVHIYNLHVYCPKMSKSLSNNFYIILIPRTIQMTDLGEVHYLRDVVPDPIQVEQLHHVVPLRPDEPHEPVVNPSCHVMS